MNQKTKIVTSSKPKKRDVDVAITPNTLPRNILIKLENGEG